MKKLLCKLFGHKWKCEFTDREKRLWVKGNLTLCNITCVRCGISTPAKVKNPNPVKS